MLLFSFWSTSIWPKLRDIVIVNHSVIDWPIFKMTHNILFLTWYLSPEISDHVDKSCKNDWQKKFFFSCMTEILQKKSTTDDTRQMNITKLPSNSLINIQTKTNKDVWTEQLHKRTEEEIALERDGKKKKKREIIDIRKRWS